jgi:cytidylate kinase
MNNSLARDTVDTYLNSQYHGSGSPWHQKNSGGPFVTVSREAGSGGSSFADLLARKLNAECPNAVSWRIYEGNLIAKMLEDNRLPSHLARFLPEQRVPELTASIGELVGLHPSLWDLIQKTNETMRQLAASGHVILVGRGANFATAGLKNGIHVRLVAPAEHRAAYLVQRYNVSVEEARRFNAKCEAARRSYVKAHFGADVSNPCAYDMVFNAGRSSLDEAASTVYAHIAQKTFAE